MYNYDTQQIVCLCGVQNFDNLYCKQQTMTVKLNYVMTVKLNYEERINAESR